MDFYKIKGVVESILDSVGAENVTFTAQRDNPSYHPGRCAEVYSGNTYIGVFGQIHPTVAANYGVDAELYTAELMFDAVYSVKGALPQYTPLPKYPTVTRDIAVVCDKTVTVYALSQCIKRAGGNILRGVELFDIYTGSHIADDKKSVAFSLTLRDDNKTLTVEEADEEVGKVLAALQKELGAVIR